MDRKTERGQMILETLIVVLMFAGFFLVAVTITRDGEKKNSQYRFNSNKTFKSRSERR